MGIFRLKKKTNMNSRIFAVLVFVLPFSTIVDYTTKIGCYLWQTGPIESICMGQAKRGFPHVDEAVLVSIIEMHKKPMPTEASRAGNNTLELQLAAMAAVNPNQYLEDAMKSAHTGSRLNSWKHRLLCNSNRYYIYMYIYTYIHTYIYIYIYIITMYCITVSGPEQKHSKKQQVVVASTSQSCRPWGCPSRAATLGLGLHT